MSGDVGVRPVQLPEDGDFLRSVYASTREPELSELGWSEAETAVFLRRQFDAQARHLDTFFPHATQSVILVGNTPVGRLIVARSAEEIRIVDIAFLSAFRHLGFGGVLIRRLLEEADARHLPVRCHVLQNDKALGFWEHVGLVAQGLDGIHVAMERACGTSPP
jgi:GNAT superfamily N-acetyltransferase